MLTAFSVHGGFGLKLTCRGDLNVDCHHTIEDVGIALGKAFSEALGDKGGIMRYGSFYTDGRGLGILRRRYQRQTVSCV